MLARNTEILRLRLRMRVSKKMWWRAGLLGGGFLGDAFDFYEGVFGEGGYLDGGTCWWHYSCRGEVAGVDFVHRGEVLQVFEEDSGFDDVDHVDACCGEDGLDVFEHTGGLLNDAAGDEVAGVGIECDLAGGEKRVADADGLRVGADGGGGVFGRDGGLGL